MTIDERIAYAERRLNEAIENDSIHDIVYWRGYRDGLKAVKTDG